MYLIGEITRRNDLGYFLSRKNLSDYGVEVGTHRGEFAQTLLMTWQGKLFCVDPWENMSTDYRITQGNQLKLIGGRGDRIEDYQECEKLLSFFKDRVMLMKMESTYAASLFEDDRLDFVYLDGDHNRLGEDLRSWYPKVKPGGIISGHDWLCPGEKNGGWGRKIQKDLHLFAESHEVDVYLITEANYPWSFYFYKPYSESRLSNE